MRKIFGILLLLFFSAVSRAQVPLTFTAFEENPYNRIWIPCSFGLCMIDLGGKGSVLAVSPMSETLLPIKTVEMGTVSGSKSCDLVAIPVVILAGRYFTQKNFYRCDWFRADNSPMLGLDYFIDQKFSLDFPNRTFTWLYQPLKEPKLKLHMVGHWPGLPVSFGANVTGSAVLDTGAPFTLVDQGFVQSHPQLFKVDKNSPEKAELLQPLVIGGFRFFDKRMLVLDLKGHFGSEGPDFFIGLNHLKEAHWELDYSDLELHIDSGLTSTTGQ